MKKILQKLKMNMISGFTSCIITYTFDDFRPEVYTPSYAGGNSKWIFN